MKKLFVLFTLLLVLSTCAAFAKDYEVKGVTGKVTFSETEKGKQKALASGMKVSDETFVTLGTNSKLVLADEEGKEITLRTPKTATVSELIDIKLGISGSAAKKGKGEATASSRASDVMADGELDD